MTLNTDALISDITDAYKRWRPWRETRFINPSSKCTKLAHMHRENGIKYYSAKKFMDALRSYTLCIAYALEGSEELAQGYGARSAVLFKLEKYAPCLYDTNRALRSHNCSHALRKKLVSRKKRCLDRMKSSSAGGSGGGDKEVDEDATDPPSDREPNWRADMLRQFGNPLLPNASPKIKLKYDEIWGSHFVATADIKVGEPLLREEYFLTMPDSVNIRYKCCDFCTLSCDALIPCLSCAKTMYCSATCRSRAYDSYHRIECPLSYLIYLLTSECARGIRLLLIGTEQGAALEDLMNTLSISDIFARNRDFTDKPFRSDYLTALSLTRWPFDQAQVNSFIENAVQIVVELRKDTFFESVSVDRLENAMVFATALLINNYMERHMHKLDVECSTMSPRTLTDSNTHNKSRLCSALMLLNTSLNHSCNPNVALCTRKRELILFAVRPVRKEEQLFIDFLSGTPKAERTRAQNFNCQCEACSNNWPTYLETDVSSMTWICEMHKKMRTDLIPYNGPAPFGHNPVLSEINEIVAPLLNDTTLLNLPTGEIFRIIADTMSLLYEVMLPTSLVFVHFRRYLQFFAVLYYRELEPDRTQNESLKFSDDRIITREELLAKFGYPLPKIKFDSHFAGTVCSVISRICFYTSKGKFTVEKIVG